MHENSKFWRQIWAGFFWPIHPLSKSNLGIFIWIFKNWRQKWRNFEKNPIFQEFGPFLGQSGEMPLGNGQKWRKNWKKLARKLSKLYVKRANLGSNFGHFWGDFWRIFGIFGLNVHFWAGGLRLGPKELQKSPKNCPIWAKGFVLM